MRESNANNFDLIRLVAATQVAIHHSSTHLQVNLHESWLFKLTALFPGVPIFFFVSGFLISKSFERNPELVDYVTNRVLRIFPALIVCFALSVSSVYASGYFETVEVSPAQLIRWFAAQVTFLQFFNPEFMRGYGVGVLNGSLWTIPVELQFYIIVPLLYLLAKRLTRTAELSNALLIGLIAFFLAMNQYYVLARGIAGEQIWYKLLGVSFAPWVYMFLVGVLFQRNFAFFHRVLAGRLIAVSLAYVALALGARFWFGWSFGNTLNPVTLFALCVVTFAAAYSFNTLSDRLLQRNDISYGMYIYHMPVTNLLIHHGFSGSYLALAAALFMSAALALLSWRLVEKPALGLKRHPLYRHIAPAAARAEGASAKGNKALDGR